MIVCLLSWKNWFNTYRESRILSNKLWEMHRLRYSTRDHWKQESLKWIFNSGLFWAVRAAEKKIQTAISMLLLRAFQAAQLSPSCVFFSFHNIMVWMFYHCMSRENTRMLLQKGFYKILGPKHVFEGNPTKPYPIEFYLSSKQFKWKKTFRS